MSAAAASASASDEELQQWINKLNEQEMRDVLHYMLLLNADAVQGAMQYVQRKKTTHHNKRRSLEETPPPPIGKSRSRDGDDDGDFEIQLDSSSRSSRPPQPESSSSSPLSPPPHASTSSSTTRRRSSASSESSSHSRRRGTTTSNSSVASTASASTSQSNKTRSSHKRSSSRKKKTVVVLCTMKPTSRKQADDQDRAMELCKANSVLPFIVLKEQKVEYNQQLLAISRQSMYPQFFLKYDQRPEEFWGDYDTVKQWHVQGLFKRQLEVNPKKHDAAAAGTTNNNNDNDQKLPPSNQNNINNKKRLDAMFRQTGELRMSMQKKPYQEVVDDDDTCTTSSGEDSSTRHERRIHHQNATTNNNGPYAHLQNLNQPKVEPNKDNNDDDDDARSLDSLGDIFDKPIENKPVGILAAAKNARAKMDAAEKAKNNPNAHLERLNQPKTHHESDDESLGDGDVFDAPSSGKKPVGILAAAKNARAKMDAAEKAKNPNAHLERLNQPKTQHDSDDESLGDGDVFDAPSSGKKPVGILAAAKNARAKMDAAEKAKNPNAHLERLNQPKTQHDSDDESLGDGDVFDAPSTQAKPVGILAAAKNARAKMEAEQAAKNPHGYLETLNQPVEEHDSDNDSLGDDVAMLFEPPKPPPPSKPLLSAAKKAAEARQSAIIEEEEEEESSDEEANNSAPPPPAVTDKAQTPRTSNNNNLKSTIGNLKPAPTPAPARPTPPSSPFGEKVKLRSVGSSPRSSLTSPSRRPSWETSNNNSKKSPLSPSKLPPTPSLNKEEAVAAAAVAPPPDANVPAWMQILKEQEEGTTTATATTSSTAANSNETSWMANAAATSTTSQEDATAANNTTANKNSTPNRGVERQKSLEKKYPEGGACYLVYDAVEGELNIHYSEVPIIAAVGVWTSPDILAFKHAQGLSRSELIGNCASNVQDRKNYYNGWCQFIKAAKSMDATVTCLGVGVPVDFFLYQDGTTTKAIDGTFETEYVDAVACVPKNQEFDISLKGKKWSKAAKKIGAVAMFKVLSSKDGSSKVAAATTTNSSLDAPPAETTLQTNSSMSSVQGAPPTIPEDEEVVVDTPLAPVVVAEEEEIKMAPTDEELSLPASPEKDPEQLSAPAPAPPPPAPPAPTPAPPTPTELAEGEGYASAVDAPAPDGGACYLVYEPESSGRLVEYYSKTPVPDAIGRWTPGGKKKIAGFKFKQNLGKNILIGSCSAGVQGRKNYASGWCQYVRSARVMQGEVMLWDPVGKGLMVDVYLYTTDKRPSHQTVKLQPGVATSTDKLMAVACIPKGTPFYEGMAVDILKWLADGSTNGASSKFQ